MVYSATAMNYFGSPATQLGTPYTAPKPVAPAPAPIAPKPIMTPVPLSPTPIKVNPTPAPSAPPPSSAPSGFQDIRSQLVTNQPTGLASQANNQLSLQMSQLPGQLNLGAFNPVAGPNYGQANDYLQRAAGFASGVNPGAISAGAAVQAQNVGSQNVNDPNFQQAMQMLQQALASSNSPEATQLRQTLMQQFSGLSSAPDRLQLAAKALDLQRQQTQNAWQNDLRTVGQKAAALGRIGAGMTTTELGDVTLQREKALGLYGQQLANDAAGQTLQDRLNVFGAGQGLQGQFSGQDLNQAQLRAGLGGQYAGMANATTANQQTNAQRALQAALANQSAHLQADTGNADRSLSAAQSRASIGLGQANLFAGLGGQSASMAGNTAQFAAQQQGAQMQQALQQAQLRQNALDSMAGIQSQQFGQGMQTAGLRAQQQQWQNTLQQQNVANQVQQQQLQEQLLNGAFNRDATAAGMQAQYGYGNDPYSLQLAGSQYQQQNASSQQAALAQAAQAQALQQQLAAMGRSGSQLPAGATPPLTGYYNNVPGSYQY